MLPEEKEIWQVFFIYQVGEGMQVEGFRARFLLEKRRMWKAVEILGRVWIDER